MYISKCTGKNGFVKCVDNIIGVVTTRFKYANKSSIEIIKQKDVCEGRVVYMCDCTGQNA